MVQSENPVERKELSFSMWCFSCENDNNGLNPTTTTRTTTIVTAIVATHTRTKKNGMSSNGSWEEGQNSFLCFRFFFGKIHDHTNGFYVFLLALHIQRDLVEVEKT